MEYRFQTAPYFKGIARSNSVSKDVSSSNIHSPNKISPTPPLSRLQNKSRLKTPSGSKTDSLYERAKSAPPGYRPNHSSNILDIRGEKFEQNAKPFDMMVYLKSKSFPRRIQRLINETPHKMTEHRSEEGKCCRTEDVDAHEDLSCSQVGLNNKQILERRRGLHERRSMHRLGVSVNWSSLSDDYTR